MAEWRRSAAEALYAQAAAEALARHTELSARRIAEEAMKIAGKMCIYTNDAVTIEEL